MHVEPAVDTSIVNITQLRAAPYDDEQQLNLFNGFAKQLQQFGVFQCVVSVANDDDRSVCVCVCDASVNIPRPTVL